MATYEYRCESCGSEFEVEQKISDPPLTKCTVQLTHEQRSTRFDNTTGAISWNHRHAGLHPDACVCHRGHDNFPGTPHKHYSKAPFACARCDCEAYRPIVEDNTCGGSVKRLIAGATGFVLKGSGWAKDGYR